MRVLSYVVAVLVLAAVLAGCGGGKSSPAVGSLAGYVSAESVQGQLTVSGASRSSLPPVSGATITVRGFPTLQATTDDTGYFRLDGIPVGTRDFSVTHPAFTRILFTMQIVPGLNQAEPTSLTQPATRKWTVMVYMAADNDMESAAFNDIKEMERVPDSPDVKTLVLYDGPAHGDSKIYEVRHDPSNTPWTLNSLVRASPGELNTGDPTTLRWFIDWCQEQEPAQHYLLVLWNHGTGWDSYNDRVTSRAIGFDYSSGDVLRVVDLPDALVSRHPIDIIATDACLMAMLEVAYEIRGNADYLVASEEETPWDGYEYERLLRKLTSAEGLAMTPSQYAAFLAQDIFADWTQSGVVWPPPTISVIDLARLGEVATALDGLARRLIDVGGRYANGIEQAHLAVTRFSPGSFDRRVDLHDYATQISKHVSDRQVRTLCTALTNAIEGAVLANYASSIYPRARGISIYQPTKNAFSRQGVANSYGALALSADTAWNEWLASQP